MARDQHDTLVTLFLQLKKNCWDLPFCPFCGAVAPDTKIGYGYDRDTGELKSVYTTLNCRSCDQVARYHLFTIDDIEENHLKPALMEYKRSVTNDLPDDWDQRESFRQRVKAFIREKLK